MIDDICMRRIVRNAKAHTTRVGLVVNVIYSGFSEAELLAHILYIHCQRDYRSCISTNGCTPVKIVFCV